MKTLYLISFGFLLFGFACERNSSEQTPVNNNESFHKEKWHWGKEEQQSNEAGYTQAVKVGNTIYISGVPARELNEEEISKMYQSLERSLEAFDATWSNVVKENLYTTDIEQMKALNEVRKEFYHGDYPAASWVEIRRLYMPDAKVEVELIAVVD